MSDTDKRHPRDCPDNDLWIQVFQRKVPPEQVEALIDHALGCARCARKFEAMRALRGKTAGKIRALRNIGLTAEEAARLGGEADEAGRLRDAEKDGTWKAVGEKRRRFLFLHIRPRYAVAVAASLLVLAAGFLTVSRLSRTSVFRDERASELRLKSPHGTLGKAPALFRWSGQEGADDYSFRLIDDELNLIYEVVVPIPQLTLPVKIHSSILPGRTYLWKIEAMDDHSEVVSSGQAYFRLRD